MKHRVHRVDVRWCGAGQGEAIAVRRWRRPKGGPSRTVRRACPDGEVPQFRCPWYRAIIESPAEPILSGQRCLSMCFLPKELRLAMPLRESQTAALPNDRLWQSNMVYRQARRL